jgi:ssDNA thymidine ADP-ribosyltransferase, DarT
MPRIYHITHIRNLASIIQVGGLVAHSQIATRNLAPLDISYSHIQDLRAQTHVPFPPGGNLHDYVPFHFGPRSPMLYTINRGNLANCPEGQTNILHLVAEAKDIEEAQIAFVYTDGHAIIKGFSEFYNSLDLIDEVIDWNIIKGKWWNDTSDDPDRSRKRQAEFLVHQFLPWSLVRGIGVINSQIEQEVRQILQTAGINTNVKVYDKWYY